MSSVREDKPRTIVFVGDSLVSLGEWSKWLDDGTEPSQVVHNHGVSGDTTDDVLARLPAVVETQPDEILLLIGTNDLGKRRSVEHLVRNIETMLVALRRDLPGTRMLVHSILPRGREFAHNIQNANIHLRQFCATVHAQFLDLWPAFALENGQLNPQFSDDLLHLNDEGYRAWLSELLPALQRLRERPPMSTPIHVVVRDEYARPA